MPYDPLSESSTSVSACGWLAQMHSVNAHPTARERRDELAAILETALDCIIIMDAEGLIQEFNPAAERTFGYARAEVLGALLAEKIIPPAFRAMHQRGLARYVETGEARMLGRRIEVQAMRRDGSEFPAELTVTAIRSGAVPLFTAYLRDLTERHRLECANEAAVRRWQLLFDKTPLSVQIFSPDGVTVAANEAWERLFAMRREQIIGWNVFASAPLAQTGADQQIARAFAGEVVTLAPLRYEICGDPQDTGHASRKPFVKWIGALLYPVVDDAGRILEVVCIHDDATERMRTETAIRDLNAGLEQQVADRTAELIASRDQFYKAFHANPAAMTLVRVRDGVVVDVNDAFCRASNHTREGSLGRTFDELGIWTDLDGREKFERDLASSGSVRDHEITFRSATGRLDHVICSAEIIELNREPHLLTVALDLNAQKRAEVALRDALATEKETGRLKSNFVSMVSHEFRTPLGVILSSSEIIDRYLDTLNEAERREQLGAIKGAVGRMTALMEQVLMFSRIESGELECRPHPLDLAGFCLRLRDELLSATSHRCPIEFTAETPLEGALCDEKLLHHILTNLLTNAVKYSRCDEPVRFTARREGADAIFQVIDRGLGIPAAHLDQLFTAFRRARNVADLPGTGLGLVIVRKCLDAHGGQIAFASVEDEGTRVRVTLPIFPNA